MNKKKAGILMCTHFNCDHRRGNYCCFQCQKIGTCKNPCYNSPLKCGLAKEVDQHENPDAWTAYRSGGDLRIRTRQKMTAFQMLSFSSAGAMTKKTREQR